jgi:leader peptidase (prepilin peptidase)/N-methyltransferase
LHPIVEVLGAGVAVTAFLVAPWPRSVFLAVLGLLLLTAAVIDLKTRRLPDVLTVAIAVVAAALSALNGRSSLIPGVVATVITFAVLEGVRRLFANALKRPGLGFGDVKLFAALALWLGPLTPWAVVVGSAIGLGIVAVTRPKDRTIAFGPPLTVGAFGVGLLPEVLPWLRF